MEQLTSIRPCISVDSKMSEGFTELVSQHFLGLQSACRRTKLSTCQIFPLWDQTDYQYVCILVRKHRSSKKLDLSTLLSTLEALKSHARQYGISATAVPKIGCGLDQMKWREVGKLLRDFFLPGYPNSSLSLEENGLLVSSSGGDLTSVLRVLLEQ